MASLLREIKAEVEQARASGRKSLSEVEQAQYFRRYDEIVRRGVELNPERESRRGKGQSRAAGGGNEQGRIPQTEARNLVARLERCREQVLRFMTDFSVPFDNNQAERDLRMIKLKQKIGGCVRSREGAREFCRIRSVISTARKQGQAVLGALEKVFRGQPITLTS